MKSRPLCHLLRRPLSLLTGCRIDDVPRRRGAHTPAKVVRGRVVNFVVAVIDDVAIGSAIGATGNVATIFIISTKFYSNRKRDLGGGLANLVELPVESVFWCWSEADSGVTVSPPPSLLPLPGKVEDLLSWISNSEPLGLLQGDLGGITNLGGWEVVVVQVVVLFIFYALGWVSNRKKKWWEEVRIEAG